jgi:hypothetical protein
VIPSDSLLVWHRSDFVAKTLGVDTPLFVRNTQLDIMHYSFSL